MDRRVTSSSVQAGGTGGAISDSRVSYVDDIWVLQDPDGVPYEIDFNTRFGDITTWQKQVAKNFIYYNCIEVEGQLFFRTKLSTERTRLATMGTIFRVLNEKHPGLVFGELSLEELIGIAMFNSDGSLSSYSTSHGRIRYISELYGLRVSADCAVQEKFLPSHDVIESWSSIAAAKLKASGRSFAEWRGAGGLDAVPFEVSLAILAYCINLIRSDGTKYVLAWYQAERKLQRGSGSSLHIEVVRRVLSNFGATYHPNATQARALDDLFFSELRKFYPHAETHEHLPLESIPFKIARRSQGGKKSLVEMTDHLLAACLVAILILTGVRQSEARTMAADAIRENGRYHSFTSRIEKTNHGVKTDRDVANIVADFVDVLDGLGSIGFADENRPDLFSYVRHSYQTGRSSIYSLAAAKSNLPRSVSALYNGFLEGQGDDMREHCPHVTPHGFRHTWAEFAMRRFDGNIMPLIRDHYRHSLQSTMTQAYTRNKIEMSEYQELGKRHIFELVSRYIDGAAGLYGQLGEFLTARVKEVGVVEMHDRQARDDAINRIIEEDVGDPIITPHEYGLCVLREHTKSLANCRDENGIPQTDTADIQNCAGCVNSCMVKQLDGKDDPQFEKLLRLQASFKESAKVWEDNEVLGPIFADEHAKTRRALQVLVAKMKGERENA